MMAMIAKYDRDVFAFQTVAFDKCFELFAVKTHEPFVSCDP